MVQEFAHPKEVLQDVDIDQVSYVCQCDINVDQREGPLYNQRGNYNDVDDKICDFYDPLLSQCFVYLGDRVNLRTYLQLNSL